MESKPKIRNVNVIPEGKLTQHKVLAMDSIFDVIEEGKKVKEIWFWKSKDIENLNTGYKKRNRKVR